MKSSPGSILVIDDEEVAALPTRQLFRGTRYLITEADGGIEGLERARFDRPSLIRWISTCTTGTGLTF